MLVHSEGASVGRLRMFFDALVDEADAVSEVPLLPKECHSLRTFEEFSIGTCWFVLGHERSPSQAAKRCPGPSI